MKQPQKRYVKSVINLGLFIVTLLACIFVVPKLFVFFLPFIIGWIIAAIANPVVLFLEEKLRIKRKAGSAVIIVAVIALIVMLGYFFVGKLFSLGMDFILDLPDLWETIEAEFREIGKNMGRIYSGLPLEIKLDLGNLSEKMGSYLGTIVGSIGTPTVNAVGNIAKNIPGALIHIIMCVLSAYFFIAEKENITEVMGKYIPVFVREKWKLVCYSLTNAVGGYIKAQLKIEVWMYLLLCIGFLLLRIPYAPLIAFFIAVLDFLPFFGTGAVMIPWAIIKLLSGDYKMAIWLLVIWGVGQLARQIIQPKIVGDSVGLAALPTLFLLFVGYKIAGVIGMILAVPLGIIVVNMNEAGVFDTVKTSIRILAVGLGRFRHFDEEDKEILVEKKDGK